MAASEAYYYHATLYQFSGKAIEAVIGSFQKVVDNVAVKCLYDKELDGFELTCPQDVGPTANDALEEAITKYVEEELEAAAREEREPHIQRFVQSTVEDFIIHDSDDDEAEAQDEWTDECAVADLSRSKLELKATPLHSVSDESHLSTLKLFNLRDTGTGMLERSLVHPGRKGYVSVFHGFTCRAARWDPDQGFYTFNGRSGAPIKQEGIISTFFFTQLTGQLKPADVIPKDVHDPEATDVQYWKFVGERPRVDQFLDGMYETELVDPEVAKDLSEIPTDARKYNAQPAYDTRQYGRTRRPASVEPELDEDHDISDHGSKTESDDESSSSEDDEDGKPAVLKKFRHTAVAQPTADADGHNAASSASQATSTAGLQTPVPGSVVAMSQPNAQNLTAYTSGATLPAESRAYAKVDKNGLMGNAHLQAQWEHANPVQSPRKLNRHGIARRVPTEVDDMTGDSNTDSSIAMSLSTGPELLDGCNTPTPASSFSIAPPLTMLDKFGVVGDEQPWETRTQSATVKTGELVDVSTPGTQLHTSMPRSRETTGRIRPPPGLEYRAVQPDPMFSHSSTSTSSHELIDLSYEMPVRTNASSKLMWNDPPLKPTVKLPVTVEAQKDLEDGPVIERLQDSTNGKLPLRHTMRQKAGKKNKKNGKAVASKPMVQLEKPAAPPPPKPKPAKATSPTQHANIAIDDGPIDNDAKDTHIEKLLRQVECLHKQQDVGLEVSFGMIVVRPVDASMCTGNWTSSKLQRKLQTEEDANSLRTDFFERLTTSEPDAVYMLNLLPGELLPPKAEYEITLRLLQGETRVVKFDQAKRDDFEIFLPEQRAVTLYMHYPVRVHDGRSRVIKSELAHDVDRTKVESLVSSVHSVGNRPSFMALVPTQSFSVERVHVKKVFTKQIVPGVQLKIEEIQDLRLDPIPDDNNFNLKATAASRAFMVDHQRLWYECSLHLAPLDAVQGNVLQSLVDQMVAEIDGVGFHNVGPYKKTPIEEEPEPEIKFW